MSISKKPNMTKSKTNHGYKPPLRKKGFKTADEMFEELGYKKNCTSEYIKFSPNTSILFISISENEIEKYEDNDLSRNVFMTSFTSKEIKAVAKKLEEMGL